jgi:uncharacterized protein
MNVEENRRVALAFIDSLSAGRPDTTLVTHDAVWWVPGIGTMPANDFFKMAEGFLAIAKGPAKMTVTAVTAEEDRVAVEAEGHADLKDGRAYDNTYHILFRLRDGKIREAREHNNSLVPAMLFRSPEKASETA